MAFKFITQDNDNKRRYSTSTRGLRRDTDSQYALSTNAMAPLTKSMVGLNKTGQFGGTGIANVMYAQPMFFSPMHTVQNWQIASKRREISQWSFISPCLISLEDGSLIDIKDFKNFSTPILNGDGKKAYADIVSKRQVKKNICKIKVMGTAEDLVVTHDHNCRIIRKENIKCKFTWNNKNCIYDCRGITCERHNCEISKNKTYNISKVKAEEIKKGDYFLVPFNTEVINSLIKTKDQARFAGHLASDGCITGKNTRVCMNKDEIDYVYPCVAKVFSEHGIKPKLEQCSSKQVVAIRSSKLQLYNFSSKLVVGKGSEKRYTKQVTLLDPELQLEVLGAYIQSDGYYNPILKTIEITTYSKHLANQLLMMFYRCNILARVNKQKISQSKNTFKSDNTHRYIVNISSTECHKIQNYVKGKITDETGFGKKKSQHKRFFWKNFVVTPVLDIVKEAYEGTVYDIREPKTNTIVANGVSVFQCRFFYENEPKVAAAIDFYSTFTMSGFTLECKDKKVLRFYEKLVKTLKLNYWAKAISFEYYLLGDVFPFIEYECPVCKGLGLLPNGQVCNHPDGTVKKIKILNPDWITVHDSPVADNPVFTFEPDDELKEIVATKRPPEIYNNLPPGLIASISSGQPIVLSNRCISHIKYNASPYGVYGTAMTRRLFTYLAYKTKLMTANWIVAERLILPLRIVKIGSENRPANQTDIQDVASQIAAVANDPNLTLVTHHNFDYSWEGACYSDDTEILTNGGWKLFSQLNKNEEVATYNIDNGHLEYQKPTKYYEYNFNSNLFSKMYNFKHESVNVLVTPNHRMLIERNGKIQIVYSQNVKHNDKFISTVNWEGCIPEKLSYKEHNMEHVDLNVFLKLAGYYLSEGSAKISKKVLRSFFKDGVKIKKYSMPKGEKQILCCHLYQNVNNQCYNDMKSTVASVYSNYSCSQDKRNKEICHQFSINSCKIARYLVKEFGHGSSNKRIPNWIKNLPKEKLQIILQTMMNGDGHTRNDRSKTRYIYNTISKQLADDISEICLKLGYFTNTSLEKRKNKKHRNIYRIYWSERRKDVKFNIRKQHIQRKDYNGKVYCVKVPNTMLVIRRNGMISIQGNSGKIHNITGEIEQIGKEILDGYMLNQAILSSEMGCHDETTLTLTDSGFKKYNEITENDKIACYNPETKAIEYHPYTQKHVYDYEGKMIHFNTDKIDILVTPNHRMYIQLAKKKGFKFVEAKDVKRYSKLVGITKKENEIKIEESFTIEEIKKVNYSGKVYCFTVPYGLFVTKRNDKITIQGNSYSSAQVGIEVMIRRLENWRNELKDWIENHIFLPVAMMQGFVDEEESKLTGEKEYLYPKFKWDKLQLRDETPERQGYMQLHERQLISTQTLLKKFDLDYDQEIRLKREEELLASITGQVLGQPQQGAAGGMGGGMDMLGGGLGGGGGGGLDLGGGMPPGGEGMPPAGGEMGGGMPPAGGGMGGGMPAGGAMPMAAAQQLSPPPNLSVMKRGKGKSMKEAQEEQARLQPPTKMIRLTTLEQKMYNLLQSMSDKIPYQLFAQYKISLPGQKMPFVLDFAYPDVGVGIEPNGEIWHEQVDAKIHDQQRDQKLANVGWRILRFNEDAINSNMNEIGKIIFSNISEATREKAARMKRAKESGTKMIKQAELLKGIDPNNLVYQRTELDNNLGYVYLIGIK